MAKDYDLFKAVFSSFGRLLVRAAHAVARVFSRLSAIGPALRCKRSLYCRRSGIYSYRQLKNDRGALGEYLVYDRLRRYRGRWLFNVYLPKDEEKTEIDEIFICRRGS